MVYISDLKNDLSRLKSDFPKLEALEYKPLETYLLNYLMTCDNWKKVLHLQTVFLEGMYRNVGYSY